MGAMAFLGGGVRLVYAGVCFWRKEGGGDLQGCVCLRFVRAPGACVLCCLCLTHFLKHILPPPLFSTAAAGVGVLP